MRRTWRATDWSDHAAVLRRIPPQFARVLVAGQAEPLYGREEAGCSLARGRWERWPDDHADPVREFLHAWWEQSLTDPDATVPAHQVFAMCAEASGVRNARPMACRLGEADRPPQRPTSGRGGR
ncbi:hypothetical protein ACFQ7M_04220 [Streptomyces massasporeus]